MKDRVDTDILRSVFDALPLWLFVVDEDVRIQEFNAAAAEFLSVESSAILKHRCGGVLHCLHSSDVAEGCGRGPFCKDCVIRDSVGKAFQGSHIVLRRTRLEIIRGEVKTEIYALITASPFRYHNKALVLLAIEDISEIAELQRLIPICCVCKKMRDETESWSRMEAYFKRHWDVDFTHSLCPDCAKIEMAKMERVL
jgi:PAS domain-containing protein